MKKPIDRCPTCEQPVTFEPHPDRPEMERAFCACNSIGPVLIRPIAQPAVAPADEQKGQ